MSEIKISEFPIRKITPEVIQENASKCQTLLGKVEKADFYNVPGFYPDKITNILQICVYQQQQIEELKRQITTLRQDLSLTPTEFKLQPLEK